MDQEGQTVANEANTPVTSPAAPASADTPQTPRKKNKFVRLIVILLVLVGLGAGGWFLLREPQFDEVTNGSPSPAASSTPTPTQEPVDRAAVSIEILNGTGIEGEASLLQDRLSGLGYQDIDVGNADDQDNETTTVVFSSSLAEAVKEEILTELIEVYKTVTDTTSSQSTDVSIVTGLRKGQTPKPSATSSPTPTSSPSPTASASTSPTPTPTAS